MDILDLKCWKCCLFSSNKHTSVPHPNCCFSKSAISAKICPFQGSTCLDFLHINCPVGAKCTEVRSRYAAEF